MARVRIVGEAELPLVDYNQPPQFTWKDFYGFRNHVIHILRQFGSAGPMGEVDLAVDDDSEPEFEEGVVEEPDFFVVDDMWNQYDRLSIVESEPRHITAELIESLTDMARGFPGWYVVIRLGDCGLNVFSDRVLVGGRRFWDCETVEEIASRCRRPVDYGPEEPFSDAMYALWADIVTGKFRSPQTFAAPPSRQWLEAIRALEEIRRRSGGRDLDAFAYGRIRCDLHPMTKLQFVRRFLATISEYSQEAITEARSNIQQDAGEALSMTSAPDDRFDLIRCISAAQEAVSSWLRRMDVVLWWPYVIDGAGDLNEDLRRTVIRELRARLTFQNELIQMSGVFGLSLLGVADISEVVDRALDANAAWSHNARLVEWLGQVRRGAKIYPSFEL